MFLTSGSQARNGTALIEGCKMRIFLAGVGCVGKTTIGGALKTLSAWTGVAHWPAYEGLFLDSWIERRSSVMRLRPAA
jgi:hypothetical protein